MGKVKSLVTAAMYDVSHMRDNVSFRDTQRMLENALGYNKQDDMYECRYEERGLDYTLKQWRDGHETASRGLVTDLPDWLSRIRDVATVGGHLKRVMVPPPDNIVWFTTDDDGNLINFMELK
jgi:hypothetical protein